MKLKNLVEFLLHLYQQKQTYLLAGRGVGPKKEIKAKSLKIPILSENDFNKLRKVPEH